MADEKVVTEEKVGVSSSHPSTNVVRGLGNLGDDSTTGRALAQLQLGFQRPPRSGLVSSTSQRIGVLSSGGPDGRNWGFGEGALTALGAPARGSWVDKLAEQDGIWKGD